MNTLIQQIRDKAAATSFSGVAAIHRGGKALYREAFGDADRANKRKNTVTTRFAIASGTKLFTALGIGALIDAGKLSLESTVRDIFQKDFSYIDSKATVAQLLTHSSGIYDYYDEDWDIDSENFFVDIPWYKLETPTDYLPLFAGKRPKYSPGERFSYSNGGFILLGVIIEHITGRLYRDFIRESVFAPAGMNDSGYYAFNRLPENTAYGYKKNGGTGETNIYSLPIRGASDGGAFTTAPDLLKLWKALFGNKILSKNLTKAFLTPHITVDAPVAYGCGIYISRYSGMDMYFIVGGDAGVGFDSRYIPEKDLQINIISNITDGEETIRDVLYGGLQAIL
ncbi:MAG: serine hydrolase domain-containing protein [Dehalococcoidales bacterium]|jgi:CubicO group peptidase (beta-lactamase class C family)